MKDDDPRSLRERLQHDVAKYLNRVALNVAPGADFPEALLPLLLVDLYGAGEVLRPSALFDEIVGLSDGLEQEGARHSLVEIRASLAQIDALESQIRGGAAQACLRGCELARRVGALIDAL